MAVHRDMIAFNHDYIQTAYHERSTAFGIEMFNRNHESPMLVVLNRDAATALRDELSAWISSRLVADIEHFL